MPAGQSDRRLPPDAPPTEIAFQGAVALHRQGWAEQANALCADVLRADPRHFHAWHLRGLIALESGDTDRGIDFITRSLAIRPDQPMAHSNLGNARLSMRQPAAALASFEQALRLQPTLSVAWYNRANALRELHRPAEALVSYDAALALNGSDARSHCNRGLVLAELGRPEEALAAIDRAVVLDPAFKLAHQNRAALLLQRGRAHDSLDCCELLLRLAPDPQSLCIRGNVLLALDRPQEAIAAYAQALHLDPAHVDALINRSAALQRANRLIEALADCDQALSLAPASPFALRNAGNVLMGLGRPEEALARYEGALERDPQDREARQGRDAALENLFHWRMEHCDWRDYDTLSTRMRELLATTHRFVRPLSLMLFDDGALNLDCAREFIASRYPPDAALGPCVRPAPGGDRIRLAYLSADFCEHPVSHLLVGVLERHDRDRFDVIGVSLRAHREGRFEQRVRLAFDRCVDVQDHGDREVAAMMREWGVDIAVDLMGFTDGQRLGILAHRAAPVQAGFLGYAGTLGAPYIDYLLADAIAIPPGEERWYAERIVRLPGCFLPNDDRREIGATPKRTQAGLPERGFVFCAFTKPHKINPPMFAIWMRLLRDVEGSVLWLRDMGPAVRSSLSSEARSRGVAPERLIFAPRVPGMAEHLGRQALADLYLDTLPYNAHSTACDALWTGVPVLTCAGAGFGARIAASALTAIGLPELIAQTPDEYESRARELALRPDLLRAIRVRLGRPRGCSALFDTRRYTQGLEAAFQGMHDRAVRGESPAAFSVERYPGA